MKIFDVRDYDSRTVMHCKNEEEAEAFTAYLDSMGMTWRGGASYINNALWSKSNGGTCYRFIEGAHGSFNFYNDESWCKDFLGGKPEILEYGDFEWGNSDSHQSAAPFNEVSYDEVMMFGGLYGGE